MAGACRRVRAESGRRLETQAMSLGPEDTCSLAQQASDLPNVNSAMCRSVACARRVSACIRLQTLPEQHTELLTSWHSDRPCCSFLIGSCASDATGFEPQQAAGSKHKFCRGCCRWCFQQHKLHRMRWVKLIRVGTGGNRSGSRGEVEGAQARALARLGVASNQRNR